MPSSNVSGGRVERQLTELWRKNQTICKWGFMGSISHSDYDYKLNNSLSVGGTFNRTTDNFLTYTDVTSKNLDYFYRIGNFYDGTLSNKKYYKFQSTNIDGDYVFDQTGDGFNIGAYFDTDFDYFTYFFKNKMNYLDGGILYTRNYDKYSVFNFGDTYNSSTTLFKGIKFYIKSIYNIDLQLNKILYNSNKNFNDYKFSIILNEVYGSTSNGIVNNKIGINTGQNGINIILNEKWKNVLIIINFKVGDSGTDRLNNVNKFDEKDGLYYGKYKSGEYIPDYKSIILTAYNFINSINIPEHSLIRDNADFQSPFTYIKYYYVTEINNQRYIGETNNVDLASSTMPYIPNWGKAFSPFILHIDYPDNISLNSQKNYTLESYQGPETKPILGYSINEPLARLVSSHDNLPSGDKDEIFRFSGPYEPIFNDVNIFRGGLFYYTDLSGTTYTLSGTTTKKSNPVQTYNYYDPNIDTSTPPSPIASAIYEWENTNAMCRIINNSSISVPDPSGGGTYLPDSMSGGSAFTSFEGETDTSSTIGGGATAITTGGGLSSSNRIYT